MIKNEYYSLIAVKTRHKTEGGHGFKIRANPLPGQDVAEDWNTECSRKAREENPVGTVFLIWAKVTDREGGTPFLYTHWNWECLVISEEKARALIRDGLAGLRTRFPERVKISQLLKDAQ